MNYKEANKIKELAPRVNEVLKGLKIECPFCKGVVYYDKTKKNHKEYDCPECNSSGKIHYSWTPQVGEWCFREDGSMISCISGVSMDKIHIFLGFNTVEMLVEDCIPILEWEEIEKILEKAGYRIKIEEIFCNDAKKFRCWIGIYEGGCTYKELTYTQINKSRLPAVYEAVIELGKELKL